MVNRLLTGLMLVVLGAVLLMNTTGYLPRSVWRSALRFWPIIVIGAGLQVASKNKVPGLQVAIVIMIILGAMFPSAAAPGRMSAKDSRDWSLALPAEASGQVFKLDVNLEAPSLDAVIGVEPRPMAQTAMTAELSWEKREPETGSNVADGIATATIRVPSDDEDSGKQEWGLTLNPDLSTSLDIVTSVSDLSVDMDSAHLRGLTVASGVASIDLKLGLSGQETVVNVSAGVANLMLSVPKSAGLKISLSAPLALGSDFAAEGLERDGNVWSTPDFDSASTKVTVTVASGAGRVDLNRTE